MIIATSITPNSQNSIDAVKTWSKYGKVYSFNSEKEIGKIDGYNGVTFICTHRIMVWRERTLTSINAMIDFAIQIDEDLLILNSDISINTLPEFKQDGISILSRFDYERKEIQSEMREELARARLYFHGFDGFYFPKSLLKLFPPTIYCLGNCFFDYSIPYRFMINNMPVYWPQARHLFHKMHPFAWDYDEWQAMALFFQWEFKLERSQDLGVMASNILSEIQNKTIKC